MIQKVKMFTIICDNCGCDAGDEQDYSCYGDESCAESSAMELEWLREGDNHYCPDCFNEDELILKELN